MYSIYEENKSNTNIQRENRKEKEEINIIYTIVYIHENNVISQRKRERAAQFCIPNLVLILREWICISPKKKEEISFKN